MRCLSLLVLIVTGLFAADIGSVPYDDEAFAGDRKAVHENAEAFLEDAVVVAANPGTLLENPRLLRSWTPSPAMLAVGAIDNGLLLSFQPMSTDEPEPERARVLSHTAVNWFLADLAEKRIRPLADVLPLEADRLTSIPIDDFQSGDLSHNRAPNRWRWAYGGFWHPCVPYPSTFGMTTSSLSRTQVLRMPFGPESREKGAPISPRDETLEFGKPSKYTEKMFSSPTATKLDNIDRHFALEYWRSQRLGAMPFLGKGTQPLDLDVAILSEHKVAVCAMREDGMSVWTNHWKWEERTASTDGGATPIYQTSRFMKPGEWQREATFAAPFLEPFHFAVAGKTYFLVTDISGEIYAVEPGIDSVDAVAPTGQHDDPWETSTVWKNAASPIIAMITLSDNPTAFVFGKDFYMKLGRDTEPRPCRDVTNGPKEYEDPLRTVYECGRVLFENDELELADTAHTSQKPPHSMH